MKFASITLLLLMAMSVVASEKHEYFLRALGADDDDDDDDNGGGGYGDDDDDDNGGGYGDDDDDDNGGGYGDDDDDDNGGGDCKRNGKNCEIYFTLAKYEPKSGDDKCILKYKFKNDGKNKEYKVTFKEKDGDKINERNGAVVCKRRNYYGEDKVGDDGLPKKLEFSTKKNIDAKYDDDNVNTKAKVDGWKKGDTLKLTIKKPEDDDKCSFDDAKHCKVEFTKAKYEYRNGNEKCILEYKLKDKKSGKTEGKYKVVFKEKDGAKIKAKEEKDKVKCIYRRYDGDNDSGDGLPEDLEFGKKDVKKAYYKGEYTDAFVKGWELDEDLILVIEEPY